MAEGAGGMQVSVPEDVANEFKALKTRRKYRYMLLSLDADSFSLRIEETGPSSATAADFVKALPGSEARYCVYDHPYTTPDGRKTDKLFLILWSPLAATGRSKMFYTSQKQSLSKVFTGVEDAQCSNASEVMTLLGAAPEEEDDAWDPDA